MSNRRPARGATRLPILILFGVLLALAVPTAVSAQEARVQLVLRPVDQPGQYFDVTLRPGETQSLTVELANVGDAALTVRTYPADVYTIVNGGFGARLRDESRSGTTLWLDYPTDVLELPAGQGIRRTLTITVPLGASPGEYITSLVVENDEPLRGTGDVAINQVIRQAIAVAIMVPGPREPGLSVGAASHKVTAGKSVVAIAVENTGNVRLKPIAEFVLIDAGGTEVSRARVPMDTFYAQTTTLIEVPLAALLQPGAYSVSLTVESDIGRIRTADAAIPLVVEAPSEEPALAEGTAPGLTEVVQAPPEAPVSAEGTAPGPTEVVRDMAEGPISLATAIAGLVGSLALAITVSSALIVRRRRRRNG